MYLKKLQKLLALPEIPCFFYILQLSIFFCWMSLTISARILKGAYKNEDNTFLLDRRVSNKKCLVHEMLAQSNLNHIKFMGRWHQLAQTLPPEIYNLDSGVTDHLSRGNGSFQIQHAGHIKNQCFGPSILEGWEDPSEPGYIHAIYINSTGHVYTGNTFMVAYTDYSDHAILYACLKYDINEQQCAQKHGYVVINGRHDVVTKDKWCKMLRFIKEFLCVDPRLIMINKRIHDCSHKLDGQGIIDFDIDYEPFKRNYTLSKSRIKRVRRALDNFDNFTSKNQSESIKNNEYIETINKQCLMELALKS